MATSTVEQYVKTIYQESRRASPVLTTVLSAAMGVTPGTTTSMLKHLASLGYVEYVPRKGVRLSSEGEALAIKMVRRHRLIETFLVSSLGYDWTEVHEEAENLEHAVSDVFVARIDKLLGSPEADPHGDPIPREDGRLPPRSVQSLASIAGSRRNPDAGPTVVEVARILDDSHEFLTLMDRLGTRPGARFMFMHVDPQLDVVQVQQLGGSGELFSLSRSVADKILVRATEM